LGNPPWEKIKLQEEEFFAQRDPEIANAATKAARKKMITALSESNPALAQAFEEAKHFAECSSKFARQCGRFPLTATGDVNTYALFAELTRSLILTTGRVGIIIPSGVATDDTTKYFFNDIVTSGALHSLFEFENEGFFLGAGQGHMLKFCLFTLVGLGKRVRAAEFMFQGKRVQELLQAERRFMLTADDLSLFNPNTKTCPTFRTKLDAELMRKIYANVPVLENEDTGENPWGVSFNRMFDMSNDSEIFLTESKDGFVPLYEAKFLNQYDHRWATFENGDTREISDLEKSDKNLFIKPRYWVPESELKSRTEKWQVDWFLGFRSISNTANKRTFIFSVLPKSGLGNSVINLLSEITDNKKLLSCLVANLNSIVFDYVVGQKLSGTNLNFFIVKQLPVLPPSAYTPADIDFIAPRVLELVYTANDLRPFAEDMGYHGEPFRWDEVRRAQLRAELDATYARLYGLTRDELRYILDPKEVHGEDFPGETFRVLKEKEVRLYGEYRTSRLVLAAWDGQGQG